MKAIKKTVEQGKVFESLIEIDTKTGDILNHKTRLVNLKEKPSVNFSVLLDSGEKAIYKLSTVLGTTIVNRYFPVNTKSWLDKFVLHSAKNKAFCHSIFDEIKEINEMESVQLAKLESLEVNEIVTDLTNSVIDNAVTNRIRTLKKLQDSLDKYNVKNGTLNTIFDFAEKLESVQEIPCSLVKAKDLA